MILSGGSGTRLWPVSRQQLPKQFCDIFAKPLQTLTLQRASRLGTPWILTSETLRTLTELNLKEGNLSHGEILYEPFGKNTAPAIAALCRLAELKGLVNEVVGVFPSDHLIQNEEEFLKIVHAAEVVAQKNRIVTLGLKPSYPETGYGYIQTGAVSEKADGHSAFAVTRFHEKPSLEKAREFLARGGYYWNAGIFVFKVSRMIELFKVHQPQLWHEMESLHSDLDNIEAVYRAVPSISIDYAIMEKLSEKDLFCIPGDFGWSDVGSWDAVAGLMKSQGYLAKHSADNFVFGQKEKNYSLVGVQDLLVVDTRDALLLVKKGESQNVRAVVEELGRENSPVVKEHFFEHRPWGTYEVLKDTENFKSKMIRVLPGAQISYQSHVQREEHWIVTRGQGEVILNDEIIPVQAGSHVHIPKDAKHRVRNNSQSVLEFVEVQIGSYFGEDDIVRYEDDYKRK